LTESTFTEYYTTIVIITVRDSMPVFPIYRYTGKFYSLL